MTQISQKSWSWTQNSLSISEIHNKLSAVHCTDQCSGLSYQCSCLLYGVQTVSRLHADGSTGGAVFLSWIQWMRTEQIVWLIGFGIAVSCGCQELQKTSVINHVYWRHSERYHSVGSWVGFALCMSKWRLFILDMFVWLRVCVPTCSTGICIDRLGKRLELPLPAQTCQTRFLFERKQWDNGLLICLPLYLLWMHHTYTPA